VLCWIPPRRISSLCDQEQKHDEASFLFHSDGIYAHTKDLSEPIAHKLSTVSRAMYFSANKRGNFFRNEKEHEPLLALFSKKIE
jgi:hypothetical protein